MKFVQWGVPLGLFAGLAVVLATAGYAQDGHGKTPRPVAAKSAVAVEASYAGDARWMAPGAGGVLPALYTAENPDGAVGLVNASGPIDTKNHPFFTPGPNGRACVSCHQPADGMSISGDTVRARWDATNGKDPIFAAIDGSNCPTLPQEKRESHSLLLDRGLFRIFLPWPPKTFDGKPVTPEFTIEIASDPTGCNTDPVYGLKSADPHVSVYRRPRIVANEKFTNQPYAEFFNIKTGEPLPKDPNTGKRVSLNIMTDARVPSLEVQAMDASQTHLQMKQGLTKDEIAQITAFERQIYVAQISDKRGGSFTEPGGPNKLGPQALANGKFGLGNIMSNPVFGNFDMWRLKDGEKPKDDKAAFRASAARGSDVFFLKAFWIKDTRGITDVGLGNPVKRSCATCHNADFTGHDVAPGWLDLGTTNLPNADPQPGLPMFKLTCRKDVNPHPFIGRVVYTHDPGRALISGRCADIGAINLQQMRALSSRAPYFSNGTSKNLRELVDFYDRRFKMSLTEQEKVDLINFLSTL